MVRYYEALALGKPESDVQSLSYHRIETQDVVLQEQKVDRLIEIGPAETLLGMIKKTLAAKYQVHDAALAIERDIWSHKKNAREIYYESSEDELAPAQTSKESSTPAAHPSQPTTPVTPPKAADTTTPQPAPVRQASSNIEDKTIAAIDIIIALIAHKLKKPLQDIDLSQTIKKLVGGENEFAFMLLPCFLHDHTWLHTDTLQADPLWKMRSSETSAPSLAPFQTPPKILHCQSSLNQSKLTVLGRKAWERPHRPLLTEWCRQKCRLA